MISLAPVCIKAIQIEQDIVSLSILIVRLPVNVLLISVRSEPIEGYILH